MNGALVKPDEIFEGAWEAVVAGAGPAGALAARELAAAGVRVLLVEKRAFPRDKVCGGCLSGLALEILRSAGLGSLVPRAGGVPLAKLQVGFRGRRARLAIPAGAALSRAVLDARLVGAAVESGARFLPETEALVGGIRGGTRLVHLRRKEGTRAIRSQVVLCAWGLAHRSDEAAASPRTSVAHNAPIGAGCTLADAASTYLHGTIYMAVGTKGYVGVVRMGDGPVNVATALQPESLRDHGTPAAAAYRILAEAGFPTIDGLASAKWQGTVPLTRVTRPLADERLFLIGDAAGYVEPFTGDGIALALASARAVVPLAIQAIERWNPHLVAEWDRLHWRAARSRQLVCRAAALALHRPWMARLGFEALVRFPAAVRLVIRYLNAPPRLHEASEPCPP
jgi:flavin-dependent dehydrogenase